VDLLDTKTTLWDTKMGKHNQGKHRTKMAEISETAKKTIQGSAKKEGAQS
jgi:hypothetical protein